MRHLIYLLVVANLIFFLWHSMPGIPEGAIAHDLPQLPPNARRLMTLEEMEQAQKAGEESRIETLTDLEPPGEEQAQKAGEVSRIETLTDLEPPGEEQAQKADEVSGIETLTDLESPGEEQASDTVSEIVATTDLEPPGASLPLTCHVLGPFQRTSEMQIIENRLSELGFEPKQRSSEMQKQIGYWVYLSAMERKAALQITQMLDKNRDKEYYIGKENFISLGAFKESSRAKMRVSSIRKLGLDPILEPRYTTRTVHWLDLDGLVREGDLGMIREEYPDVQIQERVCP
ncbi:MAG: hypothetical protein U9P11_09960 [Pseudomonadota bacterium]|nr:hypothetical protein [Pseudomonadota bacterium]